MKRTLRNLFGNLLLLTGSIVVTVLVIELVMRITVGLPQTDSTFDLKRSNYYQKDDILRWRPRPNVTGVHSVKRAFESTFTTNSHGLRGPEVPIQKSEEEVRVLLLGDSFTWGFGVNDDETFAAYLEDLLPEVKIVNMGVTAYDLEQEYNYLKMEGVAYDPDLVVVNISPNDIKDYLPSARSGQRTTQNPRPEEEPPAGLIAPAKRFLIEKSALYNFVVWRVNSNRRLVHLLMSLGIKEEPMGYEEIDSDLKPMLLEYPPSLEAGMNRVQKQLLSMQQLLADRNTTMLISLIPVKAQVDQDILIRLTSYTVFDEDDFDRHKLEMILSNFANEHQIPFINAWQAFGSEDQKNTQLYFEHDPHFSSTGHKRYADVLAPWIAQHLSLGHDSTSNM